MSLVENTTGLGTFLFKPQTMTDGQSDLTAPRLLRMRLGLEASWGSPLMTEAHAVHGGQFPPRKLIVVLRQL